MRTWDELKKIDGVREMCKTEEKMSGEICLNGKRFTFLAVRDDAGWQQVSLIPREIDNIRVDWEDAMAAVRTFWEEDEKSDEQHVEIRRGLAYVKRKVARHAGRTD